MLWLIFFGFCALGTIQHFLFVPLGRPRALMWLLPVSESPWEHYKLAFWPLGGALCLTGALIGAPASTIVCAWFRAAAHGFCTMMGIYYFYRAALGVSHPVLWADILNFYITMFCGWKMGLRALWQQHGPAAAVPAAMILAACALFFACTAALPPEKYPMFREETKNGRDQRTGTS